MDYNIHMTKNNHGFTLIELIVTLAVFSLLVAIAAPSFNAFTDSSRRASEVNNISGALSYARSESIKRNSTVSVCARTSTVGAETCSTLANDWKYGWMIFDDTDADSVLDAGETLLRLFGPISKGSVITETSGNAILAITFRGSGFITIANAEFKYCGPSNKASNARAIIISKTGRARLSVDSDNNNIHEDGSGANLTCP
jgi:type IV fimbrial biogenesis protein FimT